MYVYVYIFVKIKRAINCKYIMSEDYYCIYNNVYIYIYV